VGNAIFIAFLMHKFPKYFLLLHSCLTALDDFHRGGWCLLSKHFLACVPPLINAIYFTMGRQRSLSSFFNRFSAPHDFF
jgi:hypothetical protein